MIALFTGRFDPLHLGQVQTIMKLGQQYDKIIVVLLDYEERQFDVRIQKDRLLEILNMARGRYEVIINKDHFAYITREQADQFIFDVYCSGNEACLQHMTEIGFRVQFVPRSGNDCSTELRKVRSDAE